MSKKYSTSSNYWLQRHSNDRYVQLAQKNKLRSRAWFKLAEIQQSNKIFKPKMTVVDLGAAPGGWSKYVMTQVGKKGRVIACDLLPMVPIAGVDFLKGDFRNKLVLNDLLKLINNKVQVVISDMMPNMCGISIIDIPQATYLAKLALKMCQLILETGGSFIVKLFHSENFKEYLLDTRSLFAKVKVRKPDSSRAKSREVYVIATGYKFN